MDWREHISVDSSILTGKPVVKGTRISVVYIVDLLSQGWNVEDLRDNYPGLSEVSIRACLAYTQEILESPLFPLSDLPLPKRLRPHRQIGRP